MTQPRQVIAGRTYLITRRCTQRQFLLRPDREVERVFLYCLGEAAQRFKVTLHAWVAMSNHEHLIIRDNEGNYPEFLAHLHKLLAKVLNNYWGRRENLWAAEQPNAVYLLDADTRFEKLVYVLCNPVAANLVERVADWPGASSFRQALNGRSITIKRPRRYFRAQGPMPHEVTLRAERLDGFEHLSDAAWSEMLRSAVEQAELRARQARRLGNVRVLGRKAVLRTDPRARPANVEQRRAVRPCIASRDASERIAALAVLSEFRRAYALARSQWCAGDRAVPFPLGTYRMRSFGITCVAEARPPGSGNKLAS